MTSCKIIHDVQTQANKRTEVRNKRLNELVAAPGDQQHRIIKFIIIKFSYVLSIFRQLIKQVFCN